jgi:hypothetical protein
VAGGVARVRVQVGRLLARRGLDPAGDERSDPVVEEAPGLAGTNAASVLGRIALGGGPGARVWRPGGEPDAPWVASQGPRQAHVAGFDLDANVAVPGGARRRLQGLCRYLLRPAVAQEAAVRVGRRPDRGDAQARVGGWHAGVAVRATGAGGEAGWRRSRPGRG